MSDRIEKEIELKVPVSKVWSALADYQQFGKWFGVRIEEPFEAGRNARGKITHPGYEHIVWNVVIKDIRPKSYFSFTWYPYAIDPKQDYSTEIPTLVEFHLKKTSTGTLLTLSETGINKVPEYRRAEAYRMNDKGWTEQMKNIEQYLKN